jgi:dihydroorotase
MKMHLRGARVIDPFTQRDGVADVLLEDGVLVAIGANLDAVGARTINVSEMWLCPGLVDMHSVLRDSVDIDAAMRGGFTTVVAAPESTITGVQPIAVLKAAPLTRNLEGLELGEILNDAVCLSQGFQPVAKAGVLRRALQYSAARGALMVLHAEDQSLTGSGVIGEGLMATRLGLPSVPPSTETSIIARDVVLLEECGGRVHFAHLTTARSVELVAEAKRRGLVVTADVTPHHLTLHAKAAEHYSLAGRVWPPLRTEADVLALQAGLRNGIIDAIACDHHRVDVLNREHPFEACSPGCEAFENAVPAAFAAALSPLRLVEALSTRPRQLLGLPRGFRVGHRAEVTVIDPAARASKGIIAGMHHTFD